MVLSCGEPIAEEIHTWMHKKTVLQLYLTSAIVEVLLRSCMPWDLNTWTNKPMALLVWLGCCSIFSNKIFRGAMEEPGREGGHGEVHSQRCMS